MPRSNFRLRLAALALAAASFLALASTARDARAAWPRDPYLGNVPVCTAVDRQDSPRTVPDGAGGMFVVWNDGRGGLTDWNVYAQHVNADGAVTWAADGVPVCSATNVQLDPDLVPDGFGGLIVAWQDYRSGVEYDVYMQRLDANGAPLWAANGIPVCTVSNFQGQVALEADGQGGAFVGWADLRNGALSNLDIFAQHVSVNGAALWTPGGVPVCTAADVQQDTHLVRDGSTGVIVAWSDRRTGGVANVYAQRLDELSLPQWTANGVLCCSVAGPRTITALLSDDQGGAMMVFDDQRLGSSNVDVYAQRISPSGGLFWPATGLPVCTATGNQRNSVAASDGAHGLVVAWTDYRAAVTMVYAQRIASNGAALWAANGNQAPSSGIDDSYPAIVGDGGGGAVVLWEKTQSSGDSDIQGQHFLANGDWDWGSSGVLVSGAASSQIVLDASTDGAGGAIAVWMDLRNGTDWNVYGQRVDRYAQLGDPAPRNVRVRDVPGDQGGQVKLSWDASYLDTPATIEERYDYLIWRSVPPQTLARELASPTRGVTRNRAEAAASGKLWVESNGATDVAWEMYGGEDAQGFASYSRILPTGLDSLPGQPNPALYRIELQQDNSPSGTWFSATASGYSIDNIAPATPAPFSGSYSAGRTRLRWNPNVEADLAGYRIYRGATPGFTPGPGSLFAAKPDTGYTDLSTGPHVYKVTAIDVHGNESAPATFVPSGTVDAPAIVAGTLALAAPSPNPARGATALRWTLPRAGRVQLAVFDAAGRQVRTLVDGAAEPGEHVTRFELAAEDGRALPAGLYLVRLEADGRAITRRVAAVH